MTISKSERTGSLFGCLCAFRIFIDKHIALACQKPICADTEIFNEISQPSRLKHIACRVLFDRVHIPPIDAVHTSESLPTTNNLGFFEKVQSLKEPLDYSLGVFCLHRLSDCAVAWANLAFTFSVCSANRFCKSESVSGLKLG